MMLDERWGIFVDLEGFSAVFERSEGDALYRLRGLMDAVVGIGDAVCRDFDTRFFAYQAGDGFFLVGDLPGQPLDLPLAIGLVLHHYVALHEGMAKVCIVRGGMADIQGCYSDKVRKRQQGLNARLGLVGHLVIYPVMGTAMTRSYRLANRVHGAVLAVQSSLTRRLPPGIVRSGSMPGITILDWVHSRTELAQDLARAVGTILVPPDDLAGHVRAYAKGVGDLQKNRWARNTVRFNGCLIDSTPVQTRAGS